MCQIGDIILVYNPIRMGKPIGTHSFVVIDDKNGKNACVKAEQFYYFNKSEIKYRVLGKLDEEIFNLILEFIQELNANGVKFKQILDNT